MIYHIAEKFKSIQGEGLYTGTPMAFIRFVGCSVGKKICQHCDTDFDKMYNWRGGGAFSAQELLLWTLNHEHVCLTGGEPFDQDLTELLNVFAFRHIHIETSGTKPIPRCVVESVNPVHLTVSPKPGFLEEVVAAAREIKIIVPGLGINPPEGTRWPDIEDAVRWAKLGRLVYLQPRNDKFEVNTQNLLFVKDLLLDYPNLRLSVQMHKILKVQ